MIIQLKADGSRQECTQEKMQEIRGLWSECFSDSQAYMDFYFDYKCKDNRIYLWIEDHKVVSMVQLNPYTLVVRGEEIQSYYIVGVATDPKYRKRGLMRRLLNTSMEDIQKEGIPFVYLMPASESIYLPFDYRHISRQINFAIPIQNENEQKPSEQQVSAAQLNHSGTYDETYDEADATFSGANGHTLNDAANNVTLCALADYANHYLKERYEIYTKRSAAYYQRMLAEMRTANGDILVFGNKGSEAGTTNREQIDKREEARSVWLGEGLEVSSVAGYLAYMVEDGKLQVLEAICEESELKRMIQAVMEHIGAQDSKRQELDYEELQKQAPTIMARIIDAKKMLERITARKEIHLNIEIVDPILEENNGYYHLDVTTQGSKVYKLDELTQHSIMLDIKVDTKTDRFIRIEIAQLTQFVFGQLTVEEFIDQSISADNISQTAKELDQVSPYKTILINEIV